MTCFVTVGTTSFDDLVRQFDAPELHASLRAQGVTRLEVQIGRGERPGECQDQDGPWTRAETAAHLPTTWFRFAPSLDIYMRSATLVVSHGGAGSIMEALALHKPLVVVTNTKLMDNHQTELADALQERGHLRSTTCDGLDDALRALDIDTFVPYPEKDLLAFPALVDQEMGFQQKKKS